jgi:glycosyltransferase involved in cell wall biosynthesis
MSAPRVSIAMASFEGGPYVTQQLESIAAQTQLPDELVVCDDASQDDTRDRLRDFASHAPFEVRLEINRQRLRTTQNFEKAVSLCRGDIIFLADQDDVWLPHKIETTLRVFTDRAEVGAVFSDGQVVDSELKSLGYSLWESLAFTRAEQRLVRSGRAVEVFLKHVVAAGTTLAFRSDYRRLALPFPKLRSCHDAFIAFTIAAVAEIRIIEQPLIHYRLHGENLIGIRKLGLREQLQKAKEQVAFDAFSYAATFFDTAQERFAAHQEARFSPSTSTLALIDEKIRHSRRRAAMPGRLLGRLPDILREAVSGRYGRYSYGIKSIAQDLWLR